VLANVKNNASKTQVTIKERLFGDNISTIIIVLGISLDIQNIISQGYFRGTWTLK
jgi:hypothetical protein